MWKERLRKPRANPGQWFRLDGDFSESVSGALRAGRYPGTVKGELETSRRKLRTGRFEVYVRVIPEDERELGEPEKAPAYREIDGVLGAEKVDRSRPEPLYWSPLSSPNGTPMGMSWQTRAAAVEAWERMRDAGHV